MRLLVDTHVPIWASEDRERIPPGVRAALAAEDVLLSAIVPWEIAVKRSLGRLRAPASVVDDLLATGARPLPVTFAHAVAVEALPHHHRDPFDRLLVAQAQVEDATIVSADPRLRAYDVGVLWD